jgi:L-rhamnose isomerase
VGSAEFTLSYSAKNGITPLMDNGHYHPTEVVSDKMSALLCFNEKVALHVTRGVRWDSDHVVLFDDETKEIMKEIVAHDALNRVFIATDYFDASINRISAWVTGVRNVKKAVLYALLTPHAQLRKLQDENRTTELMLMQEQLKMMPFGEIWEEYCRRENVELDPTAAILDYEKKVLVNR